MISSREVQNVWKFHNFRSGSSLSVHDSHAFQRTPGPERRAFIQWVEEIADFAARRGNILRYINIVCKCSLSVYFEAWSGERTSWAIFQRNVSKVIMKNQQIESWNICWILLPSPLEKFFCAVVNSLMALLIYASMTMLKFPPTNNITTSAL